MRNIAICLASTFLLLLAATGAAFSQEGDPVAGESVFKSCTACHQIGEGAKNRVGPVLNVVVGREAGTFEGYKYGTGLKAPKEMA